jgi:hypothetical protein
MTDGGPIISQADDKPTIHFWREGFIFLTDAWKQACSRLGNYDEAARLADEALGLRAEEAQARLADKSITDDERATAEAALEAINVWLRVRTDEYVKRLRPIERLMRDALADGPLYTWIERPDGQMRRLSDEDREAWREAAPLHPDIASIPDPDFNPGPNTEGLPARLEESVFEEWMKQCETGAPGSPQPTAADSSARPRPPSDKDLKNFVEGHIRKTEEAGKTPTASGAEEAARDALPGATRDRVREEFKRQAKTLPVGRPRK